MGVQGDIFIKYKKIDKPKDEKNPDTGELLPPDHEPSESTSGTETAAGEKTGLDSETLFAVIAVPVIIVLTVAVLIVLKKRR